VSYRELVELFFDLHDPTGEPDTDGQYRSAIFTHSAAQRDEALAARDRLQRSGRIKGQIGTQIVPAATFWPAEDYHQQYMEKGGYSPACERRSGGKSTI